MQMFTEQNFLREKFVMICFVFTQNLVALITRLEDILIFGAGFF